MKTSIIYALGLALTLVVGCDTSSKTKTTKGGANAACAGESVDVSKLEGVWVKQVLHNDGRKEHFTEFRLRFEGLEKVNYVAGINPFEMTGTVTEGNLELGENVSEKDVAVFKEKNDDPQLGLRRLLTVRPKSRGCKIEVVERYETYVNGKRIEQRTETPQFTMVPYDGGDKLSFEKCTEVQGAQITAGGKDKRVAPGTAVKLRAEGAAKDLADGCKPVADFFVMGELATAGIEGRVEGDKAYWEVDHTFAPPKAGQNATFVEIYRYSDCAGAKKLSGVACNVLPLL